ncbi:extracellular solute-binding protein [Patescibacteria group bacterium]|nr:extracellular solute-binding protein [Patescibacteria group bacterium]
MNKKITLALLPILSLILTACTLSDLPVIGKYFGSKPSSKIPTGPVSISMWGLWENPDVINALTSKYKEAHPNVTVNYDDRSILNPVDYKERVFTRASDNAGADVMRVHVSWVPRLKAQGLIAPMPDDMLDVNAYKGSIYPVAANNLVLDGKLYGVPAYYDGLVMVYNKDHFAEVGQTAPPTAWEELRRLAMELVIKGPNGEIIRGGAALGGANNIDFFSDIVGMLFAQARVSFPNDVDSKPAKDALVFYSNFITVDKVWSDSLPEASRAFAEEKASIIFIPSWNLLDILAARPDLNIGVAPVPQALPEEPATWGSFWVDVVPVSSQNQAVAWDFLTFLSQSDQQLLQFSEASKKRAYGPPYILTSLAGELSSNAYLKAVVDSAPLATSYEFSARAGNRRQTDALKNAVNAALAGGDVETALTAFKAELTR